MPMCDPSDDDGEDLIHSGSPTDGSSKDVILPVGPLPDASSIVISDGELAPVCEPGDDGIESLNQEFPKDGIGRVSDGEVALEFGYGDEACEDSKVKLQDLEIQPDGLSEDLIISPPVVSGAKFMWDLNELPDVEEYEDFNSAVVSDVSIAEPEFFLEDMVMFVRKLAVNPLSKKIEDLGRCFYMTLDTRRILFMGMEVVSTELEYPDQIYVPLENKRRPKLVRRRSSNALHSSSGESNFKRKRHDIADLLSLLHDEVCSARSSQINRETPKRKLGKLVLSLVVEDPVVEVRIGPDFQAEIPNWTGPSNSKSNCDDEARWLGTRLWPIAGGSEERNIEGIGAGRLDLCLCHPPGSKACVRYHNSKAKIQLRSELGPAFYTMGFDMMGEDVSASWARVDQITFDILVRVNLFADGRTFLGPALKHFPSRSRREIIAYYFNVHVPRRMSSLTREKAPEQVDSDDDGCDAIPSKNPRARMKMLKTVARKGGLRAAK